MSARGYYRACERTGSRIEQEPIERWIAEHGYKSFNEYVCALIDRDMSSEE